MIELGARSLAPGAARSISIVLEHPISFWGGVDEGGTIVDVHHPQRGQSIAQKVLVMASGRGSSSSSTVLAELIRSGRGPAGIVLAQPDAIVVLGAIVAQELYGLAVPVVVVSDVELLTIPDDVPVTVEAGDHDGRVAW